MKTLILLLSTICLQIVVTAQAEDHSAQTLQWLEITSEVTNTSVNDNMGIIIYKDASFNETKTIMIGSIPFRKEEALIPLKIKFSTPGVYSFKLEGVIIPDNRCAYIQDLLNSTYFDLKSASTLTFNITDTTKTSRFLLYSNKPSSKYSVAPNSLYAQNGKAVLETNLPGNWNYIWKNANGKTLTVHASHNRADTLQNVAPGVYYVTAQSKNKFCSFIKDTIEVKQADPLASKALLTNKISYLKMVSNFPVLYADAPQKVATPNSFGFPDSEITDDMYLPTLATTKTKHTNSEHSQTVASIYPVLKPSVK